MDISDLVKDICNIIVERRARASVWDSLFPSWAASTNEGTSLYEGLIVELANITIEETYETHHSKGGLQ